MARGWESVVTGLIVLVGVFILLNAAVMLFGVDSRDGNDWNQHPRT